jgi:hypothetical protein
LEHLELAIPELRDMHMQPALERAQTLSETHRPAPSRWVSSAWRPMAARTACGLPGSSVGAPADNAASSGLSFANTWRKLTLGVGSNRGSAGCNCRAHSVLRSMPEATWVPTMEPAEVPMIRSALLRSTPTSRRPLRNAVFHAMPVTPPPPRTSANGLSIMGVPTIVLEISLDRGGLRPDLDRDRKDVLRL